MAIQTSTLDIVDAAGHKLTHAAAIIDLIRSAGGADMREHTLTEASDAALVLIDDAQALIRQVQA